MPAPDALYPALVALLQALGVAPNATATAALAELVVAVLRAQSVRPADLMRALMSRPGVPARQRHKRVARAFGRPWLSPAALAAPLARAALGLVGADEYGEVVVAIDGLRCGPWEVLLLGPRFHGRALPIAWAVLPYPWPKGAYTPTACALVRLVADAWPPAAPRPHLVADRGFPSRALFEALARARWGYTVRLRAQSPVTADGATAKAGDLAAPLATGRWRAVAGAYGAGARALPGTVVAGKPLPVLPAHQANPGSLRARAARRAGRARHLAAKHPGRAPDRSAETCEWVLLFSTRADARGAQRAYGGRWAVEGTFRDLQGGWDGRHGWGLEEVAARAGSAERVAALVGLLALGYLAQAILGHAAGLPDAPPAVADARRGWSTTGRLSVWARGQFALADRSADLDAWAADALRAAADCLAAAPRPVNFPARLARAPRRLAAAA